MRNEPSGEGAERCTHIRIALVSYFINHTHLFGKKGVRLYFYQLVMSVKANKRC